MKKTLLGALVLGVLLAASSAFSENSVYGLQRFVNSVTIDTAPRANSVPIKNIGTSGVDSISYDANNGFFYTVWLNTTTPRQIELSKVGFGVGARWMF